MLTVATILWDANPTSFTWSRCYTEEWVIKLRAQFSRHLTRPFKFVCYVDYLRDLPPNIIQKRFDRVQPSYIDCLQPFEMGEPMILAGLDTLILRNIDHLADYCTKLSWNRGKMALPLDPFHSDGRACNGVMLAPAGMEHVWRERDRTSNDDMAGARRWPHAILDTVFPGSVKSYKGHVLGKSAIFQEGKKNAEPKGIEGVDVCYFHGEPKMRSLMHIDWIRDAWR